MEVRGNFMAALEAAQEAEEAMWLLGRNVQEVTYAFISLSDLLTWRARFPVTPKLCIDGREYRRRQRRRTKRRR